MSQFGNSTFKQNILDEIVQQAEWKKMSMREALGEVAEILSYMAQAIQSEEIKKDERKRIEEEAEVRAHAKILAKLRNEPA